MATTISTLAFWLLASHFVFDYALQSDAVAREKSRHSTTDLQRFVPWYYWMAGHAFAHSAGVALATGSVLLGACEFVAHYLIDCGKCEKFYGLHADQALHMVCKAAWVGVVIGGYA